MSNKYSEMDQEELERLMRREQRAMGFAPNRQAFNDTRKHYLNLKKEYDRRIKERKNNGNKEI